MFLTGQSRVFFGILVLWRLDLFIQPLTVWVSSPVIFPSIYHSTGLMASNFFCSIGIPCSLYIDDRHNGQLQVSLDQGPYRSLKTVEEHNLTAAKSAIFLVACYLIALGYFLGLSKSILTPQQVVPYLGFLSDSVRMVFHLNAEKKEKFLNLIPETLSCQVVSVKTLQRLAGKYISFSLVVPGALLFTRQMNCAISKGMHSNKPVCLNEALQEEITHWLLLENWDDPLPWRDECHLRISLATDASGLGWGGKLLSPPTANVADYWTETEQGYDINTREAIALNKVVLSFTDVVKDARVDAEIDNKALYFSWCNQGGRSVTLNRAIKELFFTMVKLNIVLQLSFIPTNENPAEVPSRRLSTLDSMLSPRFWGRV